MRGTRNTRGEYRVALETVDRGNFDEVKETLDSLGFKVVTTEDPNHWMYYHSMLRGDPIFGRPRNLFRGHGKKRDSKRLANRDKSQAKQIIKYLRDLDLGQESDGETDDE